MATILRQHLPTSRPNDTHFDLAATTTGSNRRLPEIATGVLIIVVFALAALWWQASATKQHPVLALRHPIERGHVLTVADLQVIGISTDNPIATLTQAQSGSVIGRIARTNLPAGALITVDEFNTGSVITKGEGVVGLSLEPGQFPSLTLAAGDVVAVVLTPATGDQHSFDNPAFAATVLVARATVVEASPVGVQGHRFVAVQVSDVDAARVAEAASANRVRLIQVAEGN